MEDLVTIRRQDKSLNELVEPVLQIRIYEANLSELLEALQWTTRRDREDIMSRFENHMMKLMSEMPFDELIKLKSELTSSNELLDEIFKSLLRRNHLVAIDQFAKSNSFRNANFNVDLLSQIADLLTSEQWETVLNAFCENNQVYNSFYCPGAFGALFKKSVERSGSVQFYWSSFREKLNKFGSDECIDKLKHVIDSYPEIV